MKRHFKKLLFTYLIVFFIGILSLAPFLHSHRPDVGPYEACLGCLLSHGVVLAGEPVLAPPRVFRVGTLFVLPIAKYSEQLLDAPRSRGPPLPFSV